MSAARAHRKISINTLSFKPAKLDAHVNAVARLGASAISPGLEDVSAFGAAATKQAISDAGLVIATLTHRAFGYVTPEQATQARARLDATLAIAETIEAQTVTLTTGGRGALSWVEAAARFAEEIAPCARRAEAAGIKLTLEPTSHLYADASIAHRLSDTISLARSAGIHVGIDVFACWVDADIEDAIATIGANSRAGAGQRLRSRRSRAAVPGRARRWRHSAAPAHSANPRERLSRLLRYRSDRPPA